MWDKFGLRALNVTGRETQPDGRSPIPTLAQRSSLALGDLCRVMLIRDEVERPELVVVKILDRRRDSRYVAEIVSVTQRLGVPVGTRLTFRPQHVQSLFDGKGCWPGRPLPRHRDSQTGDL